MRRVLKAENKMGITNKDSLKAELSCRPGLVSTAERASRMDEEWADASSSSPPRKQGMSLFIKCQPLSLVPHI